MNVVRNRWMAAGLGVLTLTLLYACEVTGVGVDGTVGYAGDYYEPYGYAYGGWGPGYRVGPYRGGDWHGGGHPSRPFRSAAPSRALPSLPSRSRR